MASYERVTICDVGPRDGLQNQPVTLAPGVRAELVDRLAAAGVPRIEAVSFVSPKAVPQMAGAEEVVAAIERREGVVVRGPRAERARATTGCSRPGSTRCTSRSRPRRSSTSATQRASVEESVAAAERILERAHADGIRATVTIGVAFGCPFEGAVDPGRVAELAARSSRAGADEICARRHDRRRRAAPGARPRRPRRAARRPGRHPPAQHAQHRVTRTRSPRSRRG